MTKSRLLNKSQRTDEYCKKKLNNPNINCKSKKKQLFKKIK